MDINDVAAISKTPIINSKNDNFIMSLLDDLINFKGFEPSNYIKVDVERTEDKLIKEAKIFDISSIKSILIEISMDNYDYISSFLESKILNLLENLVKDPEMQTIYLQKYNLL